MTGSVIWITGLSGAGKTTLAREVMSRLRACGETAVLLDGDELRAVFGVLTPAAAAHSREARLAMGMSYSQLGRVLALQGFTVVIATISLFRELHEWNRANLPNYFEIYLKVPVAELRRRDPKTIYRRYDEGSLRNVAGLDLAVDEPEAPDLICEYVPGVSAAKLADAIVEVRRAKGEPT